MKSIGAVNSASYKRTSLNKTPSDGAMRLMLLANRALPKKAHRMVRRFLLATEGAYDWMAPIDNAVLSDFAAEAISCWKMDAMLKYLSKDEVSRLKS